jgi:uncharacterized lipoprotein YbaY
MKLVPMLSGVAIAVALSACAGKSAQVPVPAADPNGINTFRSSPFSSLTFPVPSGLNRKLRCRRMRY